MQTKTRQIKNNLKTTLNLYTIIVLDSSMKIRLLTFIFHYLWTKTYNIIAVEKKLF